MPEMTWFGREWGAALNQECEWQVTPTGQTCSWCGEEVKEPDNGVVMDSAGPQGRTPMHIECLTRTIAGSVGHQLGACLCYFGDYEDPPGMSKRDAARSAWALSLLLNG